jgi:hypothetical protein
VNTREILNRRTGYVLKQIREGHGEGSQLFVAIVCDNCQRTEKAATVEQLLPKLVDWYVDDQIGRTIDYCPECKGRLL